ncbi:MAG TPA: hypothetical protein VFQ88_02890 [Nevskiaceae bacterium]|nr:hypothetical protein [Nevskiaceae bacterium]
MPLQNRVSPFGALEAVAARGAWLGNRGILHNDQQRIVAQWRSKAWITCELRFRDVHRQVFSPHTWSELFFLDEATAFAAGHRPCAYCRRPRYREFKRSWCAANRELLDSAEPRATQIDALLQAERVTRDGHKRVWTTGYGELPSGAFIALGGNACLMWDRKLLPWSHWGYGASLAAPPADAQVDVLTPRSIVALFATGFRPQVHASATQPLRRSQMVT